MLHVVALSGGKDSTAMACRLRQAEPREYLYVCTPTGNESAEMFSHWRTLSERLQAPIVPVVGGTLEGVIRREKMIPNFRARFCTRVLKIEPFAAFLLRLAQPVTIYVGLRADEPERVSGDYLHVPGVTVRHPLREWGWTLKDVLAYLECSAIKIPRRTDCEWCFFQRIGQWFDLWHDNPSSYAEAEKIEAEFGHTFRSAGRDTWPAALKDLRELFEKGHIPSGADLQPDLFSTIQCRACRL